MLGVFFKRPADQVDYDVDFSRWLPDGDSVIAATVAIQPADSMVSAIQVLPSPESVKVWLVDGEAGKTASVLVTATTAQNRVKQVEFQIRVKD